MQIQAIHGNIALKPTELNRRAGALQLCRGMNSGFHAGYILSVGREKDGLVPRCCVGDLAVFQLPDYLLKAQQYVVDGSPVIMLKSDDVLGTLSQPDFISTNFTPAGPWILTRSERTAETGAGLIILPEKYKRLKRRTFVSGGKHVGLDLKPGQTLYPSVDRATIIPFDDNATDYAFVHGDNIIAYSMD